jgi:SAM-dependent methyltransferase
METSKAAARRRREGWFRRYAPPHLAGIDIGCQRDPLNQTFRRYDRIFGDPDATWMEGVPDAAFTTVYASHVLEHLAQPVDALKSWYRIARPGGHVIILVPHRDLYEKRRWPPSRWNPEHQWFFLPDADDPPRTLNLRVLLEAALPAGELVSYTVLRDGYDDTLGADTHPIGEYSIEAIVRKPE